MNFPASHIIYPDAAFTESRDIDGYSRKLHARLRKPALIAAVSQSSESFIFLRKRFVILPLPLKWSCESESAEDLAIGLEFDPRIIAAIATHLK